MKVNYQLVWFRCQRIRKFWRVTIDQTLAFKTIWPASQHVRDLQMTFSLPVCRVHTQDTQIKANGLK